MQRAACKSTNKHCIWTHSRRYQWLSNRHKANTIHRCTHDTDHIQIVSIIDFWCELFCWCEKTHTDRQRDTHMMYVLVAFVALTFGLFVRTLNADVIVYTEYSNQVSWTDTRPRWTLRLTHKHIALHLQIIEEFRDLPARFGAPIPLNGLKVRAVEANPADGCSNLTPPPSTPKNGTMHKYAVVIAR